MRDLLVLTIFVLVLVACREPEQEPVGGSTKSATVALPRLEHLQELPDSSREEYLYDWLFDRIYLEDSVFEHDREIVLRLPAGYLDLYATRSVEDALEEGGIAQLMGGVRRRMVPDAIRAYRRFGALGHAHLLASALRLGPRFRKEAVQFEDDADLEDVPRSQLADSLDRRFARLREDVPNLRSIWIAHHLRRFVVR